MTPRRDLHSVRAVALLLVVPLIMDGCGIDLTEDLSGKPCDENFECLEGWTCRRTDNICIRNDALGTGGGGSGSGGVGAAGGVGARAGSGGIAGSSDYDASVAGSVSVTGGQGGVGAASPFDAAAGEASLPRDGAAGADVGTDAAEAVDAGDAAPPGRVGYAPCGPDSCDLAATACCVANVPGYPDPPSGFSCTADTGGCDWVLECDGDHDCPGSDVCCATQDFGGTITHCQSSCGIGAQRIECTKTADCAPGLVCCGNLQNDIIGNPIRYGSIRCQDTCSGQNERTMCDDTSECSNATCTDSTLFPGIKTCQP